jgi:hypothetical protein
MQDHFPLNSVFKILCFFKKTCNIKLAILTYLSVQFSNVNHILNIGGSAVWTQGCALAIQALYCLNHISNVVCSGYFRDGISWTIFLG